MSLETGHLGAKIQSWKKANPRDLLREVMENNVGLNKDTTLSRFKDALDVATNSSDLISVIVEYWFSNNYNSLLDNRQKPKTTPSDAKNRVAAIKEVIKAKATEMVLLDFVMPGGAMLRDSTGADCARAGGWLANIAKVVKKDQIVGKVLSEAQVKKFFGV
jgi:hypothetical protein